MDGNDAGHNFIVVSGWDKATEVLGKAFWPCASNVLSAGAVSWFESK
jgi:hypothetical protein